MEETRTVQPKPESFTINCKSRRHIPRFSAMPNQLTDIAERLLAACYHNPEQVATVSGEDPVMPTRATDILWSEMDEISGAEGFDPARLSARLGLSGDGVPADGDHADAYHLLRRIRDHDVLGPVESASYGHKSDQLRDWAGQLAEAGQKDRLATRIGSLAAKIKNSGPELTMEEIRAGLINEVQDATRRSADHGLQHVSEFIDEALADVDAWERGEQTDYIRTGFVGLDDKITGVPRGELTIFAAHSGAGKTSWLIQLLRQVALQDSDQAVCLFSVEMPETAIVHRAAAASAKGAALDKVRQSLVHASSSHADRISYLRRCDRFIRMESYRAKYLNIRGLRVPTTSH